MLGWVAAVSATESPSQPRPPFIHRMCTTGSAVASAGALSLAGDKTEQSFDRTEMSARPSSASDYRCEPAQTRAYRPHQLPVSPCVPYPVVTGPGRVWYREGEKKTGG
jgi:hypothetical protein